MRRAPIVLAATAAGLGATLGFSPHSKAPTAAAVSTSAPRSSSSGSASASSSAAKAATGDAISTRYGPLQLKVTVSGGKITKIEAVQYPSSEGKSAEISSFALPQLSRSALSKQSASVDVVSGATYTSEGYKTALQSALDKVGFDPSATNSPASA
jgi:uncharacterized protein with FMN-binding domain